MLRNLERDYKEVRLSRGDKAMLILLIMVVLDAIITAYGGTETNPMIVHFMEDFGLGALMWAKVGLSFVFASFVIKVSHRIRNYDRVATLAAFGYVFIYVASIILQAIAEVLWIL